MFLPQARNDGCAMIQVLDKSLGQSFVIYSSIKSTPCTIKLHNVMSIYRNKARKTVNTDNMKIIFYR